MHIDYNNITNYQRNVNELLGFLMWCTVTPGKRSDVITPKFNSMFVEQTPTELIRKHGKTIRSQLEKAGVGQYDRIGKCWKQIATQLKPFGKLRHITREELVSIDGIGPKTASFFITHTRPWSETAVLDVHVLKWLSKVFTKYPIPEQTPQDLEEYKRIEYMFLGICAARNHSPAEMDTHIWQSLKHSA
jgi:thermostable 8-oxoguanine DNA glycosylase